MSTMEENAIETLGLTTVKRLFYRLNHYYGDKLIEKKRNPMSDTCFEKAFEGNMSVESERLSTFLNNGWSSEVSASEMSSAGFCCMGKDGPVVCFQCKGLISDLWEFGDIPLKRHRKMFPKCTFAKTHLPKPSSRRIGRTVVFDTVRTTGADGGMSSSIAQTNETDDFFLSEYNRLMTFRGWPDDIPFKGQSLAAAGFSRVDDSSDRLRCFACRAEIGGWRDGSVPMVKHINQSPHCPFVNQLDTGNRRITDQEREQAAATFQKSHVQHPTDQCRSSSNGIVTSPSENLFSSVRHGRYCKEKDRMQTFASWPKDHCQEPEALVRAGFFSVGKEDRVACFFCGGELLGWEPEDDPFEEHARHYPDCRWVETERSRIRVIEIKKQLGMEEDETENDDDKPQHETTKDEEEPNQIEYEPEENGAGKRPLFPDQIKEDQTRHREDSPKRHDILAKSTDKLATDEDASIITNGFKKLQFGGGKETPKLESQNEANLVAEVELLRDQNLCKICLDQDVEMLFLPCKHLSVCETCAERVEICPICREYIDERIFVFVVT